MKPRYELHFENEIIPSNDLKELENIARNTICYYEIYVFYKSVVRDSASSGNLKMTFDNIREAQRMAERGYSTTTIAHRFNVTSSHLTKLLRQYELI